MSDTVAVQPILNGATQLINEVVLSTTVSGTGAIVPVFGVWLNGGTISNSNPFSVFNQTESNQLHTVISSLGSVVASENTQIAQGSSLISQMTTLISAVENQGHAGGLTYTVNGSGSVGTTSGTLIASGLVLNQLVISTTINSTANVYLNVSGGVAAVNTGIPVWGGGGGVTFGLNGAYPLPSAPITAITDGNATQTVLLAGG
jgi:hypothetical protein